MSMNDWNPDAYLKFDRERTQPSIDLVSRIEIANPSKIIDIGCGPGNSTMVLVTRWPDSMVTGIDNSPAMIDKARKDYPQMNWLLIDAYKEEIPGTFDLVFSNATIQWIPDHEGLLRKFFCILNKGGILAIQIPQFLEMAIGKTIEKIAGDSRWVSQTRDAKELFTIHDHSFYFDQLSQYSDSVLMWETEYMHIMDSHSSIMEMIRSTGLKPYLERLKTEKDRKEFESRILSDIEGDYPKQKNGKVLFPFKRLFFIAEKN
jgi:trans-aconitate 2-methyltransferase